MTHDNMPYVAIIGGFWNLQEAAPEECEDAKGMAKEFGAALASAGMGLVVYSSHEESLEPHVVSGYVNALPAASPPGAIRLRFSESQSASVRFAEQDTHPDLFASDLFSGNDWEAPFYRSLIEAAGVDAVLLMAGGRSTLIAGQIALARPLPVLAVDKYPGAGKTIRSELRKVDEHYPSSHTHSVNELVDWLQNACKERAQRQKLARREQKRCREGVTQVEKSLWAGGAFVALLILVVLGMTEAPPVKYYTPVMFAGLIAAGATGALVRSVLWGGETKAPFTSLLLGGIAGFVVGIAYLIPQWIGAPEVLSLSAEGIKPAHKIQFISTALVAISAGVGFDTVFSRLKKEADEHGVSPPGRN